MPKQQNVLILGGSGLLGTALAASAPHGVKLCSTYYHTKVQIMPHASVFLDVADFPALQNVVERCRPHVILHASRIHPYEEDSQKASAITERIAWIARSTKAKVAYISSDAVFDGRQGNYREDDIPHPLTEYGKAKWTAEQTFREQLSDVLIIRTSYLFGRVYDGGWDKRTAKLLNEVEQGKFVYRCDDLFRSPLAAKDLASACWQLVGKKIWGTIHIAGVRRSAYEFSHNLVEHLGFDPDLVRKESCRAKQPSMAVDTSLTTDLAHRIIGFQRPDTLV